MKRFSMLTIGVLALAVISAMAAPNVNTNNAPAFPATLANARFVYVASYDGDPFAADLPTGDRAAIATVQNAIQSWGKLTLVDQPGKADIIIMVMSRPTEDMIAVYDTPLSGNYLWRVMGRNGLQAGEAPLMTQFEQGFDSISQQNGR
jgi:hypothetical protein